MNSDFDLTNKKSSNTIILVVLIIVLLWILSNNKRVENFVSKTKSNITVTKLEELKNKLIKLESSKKDILWRLGAENGKNMINNLNAKIKEINDQIKLENKIQNIIKKYPELVRKQNIFLEKKKKTVDMLNSSIDERDRIKSSEERNEIIESMLNETITRYQNILNVIKTEEEQIRKQTLEMQ